MHPLIDINFNTIMAKSLIHSWASMVVAKHNWCNFLSMLRLQLKHVCKRGPYSIANSLRCLPQQPLQYRLHSLNAMSSFWWSFFHWLYQKLYSLWVFYDWLHWKLSKWQLHSYTGNVVLVVCDNTKTCIKISVQTSVIVFAVIKPYLPFHSSIARLHFLTELIDGSLHIHPCLGNCDRVGKASSDGVPIGNSMMIKCYENTIYITVHLSDKTGGITLQKAGN